MKAATIAQLKKEHFDLCNIIEIHQNKSQRKVELKNKEIDILKMKNFDLTISEKQNKMNQPRKKEHK